MMLKVLEEKVCIVLMFLSTVIVIGSLLSLIVVVFLKGLSALSVEMLTKTPSGGYYLGGGGGILNAIAGSFFLAGGATLAGFFISICVAMHLQKEFSNTKIGGTVRTVLDILWGIPSIIYGVFCFTLMMFLGMGTSLLAGIIALTLLEIPIMTRCMDEAFRTVPSELKEAGYSLGSTKTEVAFRIIRKQAMPGIVSGTLLAFGRGIGDAASILFTAGFTDYVPTSLLDSTAALPTMIFFLSTSPIPEVRDRAYAAAFILLMIVLAISLVSRMISNRINKYIV